MRSIKHYIYWLKRDFTRLIINSECLSLFLSRYFLKLYVSLWYYNWLGKWPNLKHPNDLNEALLAISVRNHSSPNGNAIVKCTDKYAVREYISSHGYQDTLNELYGVYDNVEDIPFDKLPNQFVMKMNNASGRNLICNDKEKLDIFQVKQQFQSWLKDKTFGLRSGEWHYSRIKPKIVIEKYLENLGESSLIDYKFNCFAGKVYSCFVAYNRNPEKAHEEVCFDDYDISWRRSDNIKDIWHKDRKFIPKPQQFDRMVKMASELSKPFKYVRFDVYEVDGKILFGEMTFTPQGCVLEFYKDTFLKKALEDNRDILDAV